MKLLGAILAGGQSRRFGSDKASALIGGRALIEHVSDGMVPQVDAIVICGRSWPTMVTVADRPAPRLGPLGGLCGALAHAAANGFDAVLSAGCDVLPMPDLRALAGPLAAVIEGHWLFGYWPVALADPLATHLASESDHSVQHWIATCGARSVPVATRFHNLNSTSDLMTYNATRASLTPESESRIIASDAK
jgi:molybdenum cofactor guanylyltransferase